MQLRRWSLRCACVGQENGFVHHCADRLVANVSTCFTCICVCDALLLIKAILDTRIDDNYREASHLYTINKIGLVVNFALALLIRAVARSPRLLSHVGLVQREVSVVLFAVFTGMQQVFLEWYYLAHLAGYDPCVLYRSEAICQARSETVIMTVLSTIILSTHFTMPIRWCVIWVVDVTVVFSFGVASWFSSKYPEVAFANILTFTFMTFLTAIGKRQLEYTERLMFSRIVSELTLRAKAEFELQQSQAAADRQLPTDASSMRTSSAGHVIRDIVADQHHLESVADLGKREQWLLGAEELSVDSKEPLLGVGGFGLVIAGYFHKTPVALKLLNDYGRETSLADIGNELRILRKLRHPNIVLFHGACINSEHGDLLVVIERVIGDTLEAFVLRGDAAAGGTASLPKVATRCQVLAGICLALMYLHSRWPAVVHGDLKGENIIVEHRRTGPHPKLLDFGLARVLTRQAKPLGGTIYWAAPEVFDGHEPHPSADVFSFGRLIYMVMIGVKPWGHVPHKKVKKLAKDRGIFPLTWPQDASSIVGRCKALVDSCSQVNPGSRPSIGEVHRVISNWPEIQETLLHAPEPPAAVASGSTHAIEFWNSIRQTREYVRRGRMLAARGVSRLQQSEAPPPGPTPSNAAKETLCHGDFKETPLSTRQLMAMCCVMRWNVVKSKCCAFHSLTGALEELSQHNKLCGCSQPNGPPFQLAESMEWLQCVKCGAMNFAEANSDESPECDHCGSLCARPLASEFHKTLQL